MRQLKYFSPTSFQKFLENRQEFYLSYLAEERPPKIPQTKPMSVGSAFDAYLKSYLAHNLIGSFGPEFDLDVILKNQVEEQNFEWAKEQGEYIFEQYKSLGALADLMIELEQAINIPRMEFKVEAHVTHETMIHNVPILGKPDIFFNLSGRNCIYDFKVNGYCSQRPTSPKAGYIKCRGGSRDTGGPHKNAHLLRVDGLNINIAEPLDDYIPDWARQLAMYAWILGESVGSKFIVGIEQIVSQGSEPFKKPKLRIASHRARISESFQLNLAKQLSDAWSIVQSGHIFNDLSRAESDQLCLQLDQYHKAFVNNDDKKEQWYTKTMRG